MKKTDKRREEDTKEARGRRKQLRVVSSDGTRHRFLRGMITHDLVQRGLSFNDAYAVANAIRTTLADADEATTSDIRGLIEAQLEERFGADLDLAMKAPVRPASEVEVAYHGQRLPFSRGLLARSIHAAGLDLDRAYELVTELEGTLRAEKVTELPSTELARRVDEMLEAHMGVASAQRYRLVRRLRNLPRPLVIYVGGASGTGKSTLALELAPMLRIYRINATDTIRQVMRMVFTPTIMPALHTSSFEVAGPYELAAQEDRLGSPHDPEFAGRLVATFEEQARRVCVGVRAVVERAITENMSILVEGVHLVPGVVPFADLEGAIYQIPLVLATLNEETHRGRFVARSRFWGRRAERYLESFDSIRVIHEHILHLAESHDIQEIDTSDGDPPVGRTLRLVTSMLERRLPTLGEAGWMPPHPTAPTLLLIIDGLADRPVRALGGRTPLQAADTPTLDRLAEEGQSGLADPVAPGVVPDTAAGSLALFGQSPLALKRGPVEALGAEISLSASDVALRGNFATLDSNGHVIDRRAGRIREEAAELAEAIDRLPLPSGLSKDVEVRVKVATEHRLALVLRGVGLSAEIHGSDPGEGAAPAPPLTPRPKDPNNESAIYTARILAVFEQEARKVLKNHPTNRKREESGLPPANTVLTRGAGRIHRLIPLEEAGMPLRISCISGDHTILGLAKWVGAEPITGDGMTANLDTDLESKFWAALKALRRNELVIMHLKGADIAAHDRRPDLKVEFLENIDDHLGRLIERYDQPLRIAIASDHATLSESGLHAADPLPVVIWGDGIDGDDVEAFDEQSAGAGSLQRFPLQMLLGRLFDLS